MILVAMPIVAVSVAPSSGAPMGDAPVVDRYSADPTWERGGRVRAAGAFDAQWRELSSTDGRIPCIGTGNNGNRVEVIYAYSQSAGSRYAEAVPLIKAMVASMGREISASAGETGGQRHVRWLANAQCQLIVRNVGLARSAQEDYFFLKSDLQALGYNRTTRKYLVFWDGDVRSQGQNTCGAAQFDGSDNNKSVPGDPNENDGSPGRPGDFAIISQGGWADCDDHELVHALGAVVGGSGDRHGVKHFPPHIGVSGHCWDEADQLCYFDDFSFFPRIMILERCSYLHNDLFDCGHDDYFSTAPPAGSYLETHWNVADSTFLDRTAKPINDDLVNATTLGVTSVVPVYGSNVLSTAQAGEPATAGAAASHSVWYRFRSTGQNTLSIDTLGSSFDTVLGIYTGAAVDSLRLAGANDNVGSKPHSMVTIQTPATARTYHVKVDGKSGAVGAIRLNVRYGGTSTPGAGFPVITDFNPKSGPAGTIVTVTGSGLFDSTGSSMTHNGLPVQTHALSADQWQVEIGPAFNFRVASTGPFIFRSRNGTFATDTSFTVTPEVLGFSPTSGSPGTQVRVNATGIWSSQLPVFKIGGVVAPFDHWESGQPVIIVPGGAPDGPISLTTAHGTDASPGSFNVT